MLRMAHRLMMQPFHMRLRPELSRESGIGIGKQIQRACSKAMVFVVDEVGRYALSISKPVGSIYKDLPHGIEPEDASVGVDAIPNVMPPFHNTLIEWMTPNDPSGVKQAAVLFQSLPAKEAVAAGLKLPYTDAELESKQAVTAIHVYCDHHGNVVYDGNLTQYTCDKNTGSADWESVTTITGADFHWPPLTIPLLAISFMHCKNVARRDVTAEVGPSAKWIRRQKAPDIRYHVLDINPMKEVLRTEGGTESNGLKKALHICRGHFATYTEDKPLFGHITGTFWKPSHVRGSVEHGIVDKDYRLARVAQ